MTLLGYVFCLENSPTRHRIDRCLINIFFTHLLDYPPLIS